MARRQPVGLEQDALPVFGPSRTEEGWPRCSDWTRSHEPCARRATVPSDDRHGALCSQHAAKRGYRRRAS